MIVLVVVLLALGGGAYLFIRSRGHKPAPVNQVAAVRHAYLAWWNARVQEYLTSNPAPVKPYMTTRGYQQEANLLAKTNSGPFQLVATHNVQVFVYSDGVDASVDDIWLSNSINLDPSTLQPVGTPSNLTAEDSTSLKKLHGRWLVDSTVRIGGSQATSAVQLSYAAVARGVPPTQPVLRQIESAFKHYEDVRDSAYLTGDVSALSQVEADPELSSDASSLRQLTGQGLGLRFIDQDNYRVALQDDSTAWIYDTVGDQSVRVNLQTKLPTQSVPFTVQRGTYELIKGANGWLVTFFGVSSPS